MLTFALILIMILTYTAQSFFCRLYSNHYPGDPEASSPVFSMVSGFLVALVALIVCGFSFAPKPLTLLFGVINAVMLIAYNTLMVKASNKGPYSVQMVFILAGGILVPAFINLIRGTEKLSMMQWVAIVLILISIALVSRKKDDTKAENFSFYILCAGLFITNGIYGSLLNVQQDITGVEDKEEMVILTFVVAALASAVISLCTRRKKFISDLRQTKKSALFLLICSVATACAVNLLVLLINLIKDTTVLYTFDNAGVLLFSVVGSCIVFKEKLSRSNVIGCVLTCIGLVMISIF